VAICIFCPSELDGTTKPEHILHAALGGRKTTRRIICSDCNNRFGGGIDKILVEQFAVIRHLLQLPSGSGTPPMLKRVKAGRDTINIEGNGKIRLIEKPFTILQDADGKNRLQINGGSLSAIAPRVAHMAAALKIPEGQLRELIANTEASFVERRPDPIQLGFAFGGPDAMRSAAKSCLVLWATLVGAVEVRGTQYEDTRQFIANGCSEFLSGRTYLDSRIFDESDRVTAAYSAVFNMIYIKSNNNGRVVGHFTAFNQLGFSVVLAESGGSPNRQIALISNPLTGAWSDRAADVFDIPFDWLNKAAYDYEDTEWMKQRFDPVMKLHFELTKDTWMQDIIISVLKGHGLKEGDLIPREMAASISKDIADRMIHHLFNRPYKKPITIDQMREAFGSKPGNSE
jgi:hypothetical protein